MIRYIQRNIQAVMNGSAPLEAYDAPQDKTA